ncbi:olfactory receptor 13C2-like [Melanotaenia boesemani]|uniref:olfactory receptor 13C2-like n=1 Tax=Melanotaenia boesemani TaxID=1250792 RepID=UPI001C03C18C|nr:olfactory receptor 13C2-like [Melanotaenia boesemani]
MDDNLNITQITLNGYIEMNKYRYLYFCVMFTAYVLIFCSNSAIVYLIWIHKNLHEPMYVFIAALLFNCILYSTSVYPKLLIDFLSEKQIISHSACLFQFFIFYSTGGSEFLLLAAMAFDRYVSICKPLRYPAIMNRNTVRVFLVLAWFVPACHIAVQTIQSARAEICHFNLKGIFCNNSIFTLHCMTSNSITIFGLICLLNLVIFPMLFTVFTYTRILLISHRSGKEFRKKAAETCLPHLLVLISFSTLTLYDVIIARVESDVPKAARLIMTLQILLYHPLFNPFIYGFKMKEISKHLKKLFRKQKFVHHLIVKEEFARPDDPRSYVVGGFMALEGSPKANRCLVKGLDKALLKAPHDDKKLGPRFSWPEHGSPGPTLEPGLKVRHRVDYLTLHLSHS